MKIVLVTGGFDPVHKGHIAYLNDAAQLGDILIVGLNSDEWLTRKKSRPFMSLEDRKAVVSELRMVHEVITFDDSDGTAYKAIMSLIKRFPNDQIIFANGGDRTFITTPEVSMSYGHPFVQFEFGVGGTNKMNSSSNILLEWKNSKTDRSWGYYRVLHQDGKEVKVKEITVDPGKRLSLQKHNRRSELWFVTTGQATVYTLDSSSDIELMGIFGRQQHIWIARNQWHQLSNEGTEPLRLVEIQYGDDCIEDDIVRK